MRWGKKCIFFQELPIISSSVYTGNCYYQSCLQVVNQLLQKYGDWRFIFVDTNEYFFVFLLQTQFDITVASEIMAILALTTDLQDMRTRFASYTFMFSCHVPFSQTTGNHVKPTAASLSFIYKTTPWNIKVLSEKDRTNPQWYSHVHKKCWERMKFLRGGWVGRSDYDRETRTTAHFTNHMTFISPRP